MIFNKNYLLLAVFASLFIGAALVSADGEQPASQPEEPAKPEEAAKPEEPAQTEAPAGADEAQEAAAEGHGKHGAGMIANIGSKLIHGIKKVSDQVYSHLTPLFHRSDKKAAAGDEAADSQAAEAEAAPEAKDEQKAEQPQAEEEKKAEEKKAEEPKAEESKEEKSRK